MCARSDFDLGNLLDERIHGASKHQTVIDTRNIESVTRVFQLEHRDGAIYYAIVRDMTVVTVLDADMLQANFDNGSWKVGPMNMPFTKLTLRGVVAETSAIKVAPPPVDVVPIAKAPADTKTAARAVQKLAASAEIAKASVVDAGDPVTDAGATLARAMVEVRKAERGIDEAQFALDSAIARKHAASDAVIAAQNALTAAVDAAMKETP